MPSFFFTNALMLAGMSALAIPVLIHLLLKRKKKLIQFSTLRFFMQHDEQSSRRRKLRNFILLSLRLLIVALLVLAFSRPYSRQNGLLAARAKQRRVVFVLDRSASMLATGTGGQRWPQAKQLIQKAISELSSEDSAALVECATHANVLSGFAPPANIWQLVRDLPPGYGTSTLADGVKEAVRLLSERTISTSSTIYIVSDFQKSACRGITACRVPQSVELKLLPAGDIFAPNISITSLMTDSGNEVTPRVSVSSFSDDEISSATLELDVDDQRISSQTFSLKGGASTNIDLPIPALKPGWHDMKALLKSKDALEADNARYASAWIPQPAQLIIVEPRSTARVFEQETFFVSAALDPSLDSTNSASVAFKLSQVAPEQLVGQLNPAGHDAPWNVVILPDTKDLPIGVGKALSTFVRGGGGLVLFLGQGMSANRYNAELADLLPARIGNAEPTPEVGSPWRIAFYDTNCQAFAAFRRPNSGDLRIPQFTERSAVEPVESSTSLAFFDDGIPLVITRSVGKGRVVLVNTTADTAWNDWPKHKTFVPFVHGVTRYAAQAFSQGSAQTAESYIAGEETDLDTGEQGKSARFTLKGPGGKLAQLTADEHGRLRDPGMTLPGVYSLNDKTGHELRRMVVNLPSEESNLEALRTIDFEQQLVRTQDNPKQTLAAGLFGQRAEHREFWTALLLSALVLLLVEPFVANRTSV